MNVNSQMREWIYHEKKKEKQKKKEKKTQTTCQISVKESNYLFQVFSGTNWGNLDKTPLLLQ